MVKANKVLCTCSTSNKSFENKNKLMKVLLMGSWFPQNIHELCRINYTFFFYYLILVTHLLIVP